MFNYFFYLCSRMSFRVYLKLNKCFHTAPKYPTQTHADGQTLHQQGLIADFQSVFCTPNIFTFAGKSVSLPRFIKHIIYIYLRHGK